MSDKTRINTEWLSVCGGCHVAIVDLHEKILDLLVKYVHRNDGSVI